MSSKPLARSFSLLLLVATFLSQSLAATDKAKSIDELMVYCHENGLFNGTILVSHKDSVIYKNAFGYSDWDGHKPLNIKSQFCLASVSKVFTGTAIMILQEQHELDYEDTLSKFFPELPAYADRITVRQLLHHTAGIPNWTAHSAFRDGIGDFLDDLTNQDILDFLIQQNSLNHEPGEKHSYSNSGYVLLALIVERVSGVPFHRFMKRHLFDPVGMDNTLVYDESKPRLMDRVTGYNMFGEKDDYNVLTSGAGGIYSTVEDLFRWDQALYTGKLVSQGTLQKAFTPPILNDGTTYMNRYGWSYGYGWEFRKDTSKYVVRQTGGFNGFSTVLYRELYNHNAIVILTNRGQDTWQRGATMVALLNILDDKPFEFPKVPILLRLKDIIDESGIQLAIIQYHELRERTGDKYDFSERQLNELGYYYLGKKQFDEAISLFELNTKMYPTSANVYDSLGEAFLVKGNYDKAREYFKRSLELNPNNANAIEMIKNIDKKDGP